MNKAGMPATLKHYPGHGTCALDSHVALPSDDRPIQELQNDLLPFQKLINNKDLFIGMVMSNFVTYPQIDPQNVAAFSKILLDKLKVEFEFNGVITSDCLSMKGADIGQNLARLNAAHVAGNNFLMYKHQHQEKLDQLLEILDQIPDDELSAKKREHLRILTDCKNKEQLKIKPRVAPC